MSDASDRDRDSRDDRPRRADGPRKPGGSGGTGAPRGRAGAGGRPVDRSAGGKPPRRDGAAPRDGGAPKREWKPREGGDAPKRDWKPREGGAAPKRDWKPREGGAPKREWKPREGGDAPKRDWKPREGGAPRRDGVPARGGARSTDRPYNSGRPSSGERPPRDDDDHRRAPRASDAPNRHADPLIPEDVEAKMLDKVARSELRTLSKDNADSVARHLVMASRLIDEDIEQAHLHALAASRRAGRIAVVRETVAITAYATGDFRLALSELRTYRRISGRNDQLPLMVDSERGLGRPSEALELGRSVPRSELDASVQVALAIAMSGARLDLGQADAALTELEIPQLDPNRAFEYSPDLFDAYAVVLEELGRADDAAEWFARAERASEALDGSDDGDDAVEIVEEDAPVAETTDSSECAERPESTEESDAVPED